MDHIDDEIIRHLNDPDRGRIVYVGEFTGDLWSGQLPPLPAHVDAAGTPQPATAQSSALDNISPTTTAYDAWRLWQDARESAERQHDMTYAHTPRTTHDVPAWSAGYDAGYAEGWTARDISPFTDRPQGLE